MATGQQIFDDALWALGVLETSESLSSYTRITRIFNRMLDTFNAKRLMVYSIQSSTNSFQLVADQDEYTIGTSGTPDFTDYRPVKIENANILNTTADPDERWPVAILGQKEWANRYITREYEYPTALYYEPTYPNGTIHLFDIPDTAHYLELFMWQEFPSIADEAATVVYPPGYEEVLVYTLAERLALIYGRPFTADLQRMKRNALAAVQSLNSPVPYMSTDYGLAPETNSEPTPGGRVTWR